MPSISPIQSRTTDPDDDVDARRLAADLMLRYAERTGLLSSVADVRRPPRRYLWTDAFAVCNFLALDAADATAVGFHDLAARLIDQVHHVLGCHRSDDERPHSQRSQWISGLGDDEGEAHPTAGGLRIGKSLPERDVGEPFDARREWDKDGQYFHYLTKWMHALDQFGERTAAPRCNRWARELAAAAHAAFAYVPTTGGPKRLYWKMSVDLRRPLVASMGQHDPLDGLVTYQQLRWRRGSAFVGPDLTAELADMRRMALATEVSTDDPLGIGELLTMASRIEQLARASADDGALLAPVLAAAASGLDEYVRGRSLDDTVGRRIAFRELGLSIGLRAAKRMWIRLEHDPPPLAADGALRRQLARLIGHLSLAEEIEACWREPKHRRSQTWLAHTDINDVMLATSLAPLGYIALE